ncbi:MAG TPA: glycerophosphodiester phosphodiesterase family protein [Kiritimatiellia bacterium]|nr:glycerophosphodiester phosphodiesterase family protein [Kiritimatiellia bacterium]
MKIIGHRGAPNVAPENTLKAFQAAWDCGCDGIELDIRLTRDNHIVVFHDENGIRLTGSPENIANLSLRELSSWRVKGEPIPTLDEVLKNNPPASVVMIEIKTGPEIIPALAPVVAAHTGLQLCILTFQPDVAVKAMALGIQVWLNVEPSNILKLDGILDFTKKHALSGLSVGWSSRINAEVVARIHEAGLSVAVWTVNDAPSIHKAIDWGVDVLMTDDPGKFVYMVRHA